MFATKTCPSPRTLTASTRPVTAERKTRTRGRGSFGSAMGDAAILLFLVPTTVDRCALNLRGHPAAKAMDRRSRRQEIEECQARAHRQAPLVVDDRDRDGQGIDGDRSDELEGQLAQKALIQLVPEQLVVVARIEPNDEPCDGREEQA